MKFLRRLRTNKALRYVSFALSLIVALLAAVIVGTLTIDLGPWVRGLAEREGSKAMERPLHIGRLGIHVLTGKFRVEDIRIDGLHAGDRPFFTAKQLDVALDWLPALGRQREFVVTSVEMTDWQMLVEKWDGGHNFPKFTRDEPDKPAGPKRFTTTLRYLRASRGQFTYEDHEAPWSIVCPNLDLSIGNLPHYHGDAVFTGGVVKIQDHLPMATSMKAVFTLDGPRIHLDRIDLASDGAATVAKGDVDLSRWPEMAYDVKSRVHFPRMRQIFFTDEAWDVAGDGDFTGRFHLFKGGHDLSGTFASERLGVHAGARDYQFPRLFGSLRWTPHSFDVWDAGAKAFGGDAKFAYSIKPLGSPTRPAARFDTSYSNVDLAAFTDFERLAGLRFAGAATGRNLLEWPLGRFADAHGEGRIEIAPPPGIELMTATLGPDDYHNRYEWGPFAPTPLPAHLPIGGGVTYRFDPAAIAFEAGRFATERTNVTFQGTTAWGDRSRLPFHATSRDWQESDELLAGIITDFGSRTGPVAFGGRGEFDGAMIGAFRHPRVEGDFSGQDLRAFDAQWGNGTAHLVVENSYVTISESVVRLDDSEIRTDGKFSLGYPRDDGGVEIDARFRVVRHDLDPLRHAFQIDEYPVSGLLSGEFHLTGQYTRPVGFGAMTIDEGTAYGEPFQKATASLRFDGAGVRMDGVNIAKAPGAITGAAYVGWDSTYSFNADGRRIPIERIAAFAYPRAPLSGVAEFSAGGSGTFDAPRYDVKFRVSDLFVAEEGVGQVTGTITLRGKELSGQVDAASPRLAITGTGRIALTPQAESELTFRFHDSSLDPYVRLFVPRLSPYTTAIASGSVRIAGDLADPNHLLVDASVDTLDMRMFDYALKNAGPIRIALDKNEVQIRDLQVVGDLTRLRVTGGVGLHDQRISLQASGDANLGILQGFFRGVRGSGRAELTAAINGPLRNPVFSGSATITDGRVRHFSLPNSLDAINGSVQFDARGIRLDDLAATMGGGRVQFGGHIGFDGYTVGDLNVTARGEDMHLRYPEGVRSTVDADLSVRGTMKAPTLGGTVTVKNALWTKRIDAPGSIVDLASRRGTGGGGGGGGGGEAATTVPLRFDIQVLVPSTLHVETNIVQKMVASADLTLRGTYEHPVLLGHADVDRGEVIFEGRRYKITRGAIEFTNPNRIEPFFDIQAETNVRIPAQTYRVTVSAAGTTDRLSPQLSSDPPLPPADVLALLFGTVGGTGDYELRAVSNPNETQTNILTTRATQALASPLSSEVGKVVEQTFGVDTFQLSPSFIDPYATQTKSVNPSARLTIGKRISDRAYLTFSRSLNSATADQVILFEYDATDRLSWIVSRNEDETYALEFRVRHAF
ncbi:MAG TPA: translocation/assembly module TamB domain-containing protein [Vicinamibacterales bacterium]